LATLSTRNVGLAAAALVLFGAWMIAGLTAVRVIAGMFVLFFLPFYFIMRNLDIEEDERIFFSFFLGFGLIPVIVYYGNKIISSLRVTILVTVVILIAIGLALPWLKKAKPNSQ